MSAKPGTTSYLSGLTTIEATDLDRPRVVLAVPVGSTEQHGPHLPLSTDTDIAVALCDRLGALRPDVVVAPAVAYGASGEHAGFAGTLSIGSAALELLLVELIRSATETFDRVLLVSAHGGNAEAVTAAVQRMVAESRDVRCYAPSWSDDLHAGHWETSMMLALAPRQVRLDRLRVGDTRPINELWPQLRSQGVRAVSESGVLGDPTAATAAAGDQLLTRLAAELAALVAGWHLVGATR